MAQPRETQSGDATPDDTNTHADATTESILLENDFLMNLAKKLNADYLELGVYLHIDTNKVRQVVHDSKNAVPINFALLELWRNNRRHLSNTSVMWEELRDVLTKIKRADLAQMITHDQTGKDRSHSTSSEDQLWRVEKNLESELSKGKDAEEQVRLMKEEMRKVKEGHNSDKQKYDGHVQQLNDQIQSLNGEALKTQEHVRQLIEQIQALKDEALKTQNTRCLQDALKREQQTRKAFEDDVQSLQDALKREQQTRKAFEDEVQRLQDALNREQQTKKILEAQVALCSECSNRTKDTERDKRIMKLTKLARLGRHSMGFERQSRKAKTQRTLQVMHQLRQWDDPGQQLWSSVSHLLLFNDGELELNGAITSNNMLDLAYFLASGEACEITVLKLMNCEMTGDGFIAITQAIRIKCHNLLVLNCACNNKLTSHIENDVVETLKKLDNLTINLNRCSLSRDCCLRLEKEFNNRISVTG